MSAQGTQGCQHILLSGGALVAHSFPGSPSSMENPEVNTPQMEHHLQALPGGLARPIPTPLEVPLPQIRRNGAYKARHHFPDTVAVSYSSGRGHLPSLRFLDLKRKEWSGNRSIDTLTSHLFLLLHTSSSAPFPLLFFKSREQWKEAATGAPVNLQSETIMDVIQAHGWASHAWSAHAVSFKCANPADLKACNNVQVRILQADIKKWKDSKVLPKKSS